MDVEGRYKWLKVILEDTEIARGISRETRASYKKYADKYKKLNECQYMCYSIQYKEGDIFKSMHKYGYGNVINDKDMRASNHCFLLI